MAGEIDDGLERDLKLIQQLSETAPQPPGEPQQAAQGQAASPSEQAPSGSQGQPSPPRKIKIGDEEFDEAQVLEWRRGHLMFRDYTRKTQQLGEERRKLQAAWQELQPLIQARQILAQYPQLGVALQKAWAQALQDAGLSNVAMVPPFASVAQAPVYGAAPYAAPDPEKEYLVQAVGDIQLDRELEALRNQANQDRARLGMPPLSEADWKAVHDAVLMAVYNGEEPDLATAYKRRVYLSWVDQRAQQVAAQHQQASQVAGSTLRGSPPVQPQPIPVAKSFSEATRLAASDPSVRGRLWAGS